jgi:addiction module HigA family antidote
MRMHNPPHPGRVLREYLGKVSVTDAAKHLGVTRVAVSRILNGSAGISADMALKLSDALGTSPELWIGMQTQYDLWRASHHHHKRVTPLFVGAGYRRHGKSLPKPGGTIRAQAARGRSTGNAAGATLK